MNFQLDTSPSLSQDNQLVYPVIENRAYRVLFYKILKGDKKVAEAMFVFVAGIGFVFLGMACLYISIKIVSQITSRFEQNEGEK